MTTLLAIAFVWCVLAIATVGGVHLAKRHYERKP